MPLATLPGRGPITTHLEGPHSHEKCHRVSVNCTKPIPNQTPMHPRRCHSCASQRHPDTMHNITHPPIKERLPSDAQRMVKNPNKQKKLNPKTIKELAPHQPRHELSQWLQPQCTTYRTTQAGSVHQTRLPPARRPPTSTGPSAANSPVALYSQSHHHTFFWFPLVRHRR